MQQRGQIWQTANLLVDEIGAAAPSYASKWAHELLEAGDVERRADWMRVMVACKALLTQRDGASESRR